MADSLTVESFVDHFNEYANNTATSRQNAERDRDYFDHKQLTEAQVSELKRRKQPPVVFNRIQPKIMFMLGQERLSRTDPKAFPRTPKHKDSAEAITDTLRYTEEQTNFDVSASDVFENVIIEGYGGVIVETNAKTLDVECNYLPWDRIYFDIHSRRPDFSDSTRFGIVIWKDLADAKLMFPDKGNDLDVMVQSETEFDTYEDKPSHKLWVDPSRKRVMINQEYFLQDGVWQEVFFCKGAFLRDPKPSPYLDESGDPVCPIILSSCFVDRHGSRYGVVRAYIDAQDEINKRRSKALHILNSNQTISEKGIITDITAFKAEKNKPDGHMEVREGALRDGGFEFVNQNVELQSHLAFMQESKAEIDAVGANAALTGKQEGSTSGRALQARQQGGMIELGQVYDRHKMFKRAVYRAFWQRIKQFWTAEKWVRITDDETNLKFIGLNQPVTLGQQMQEHAEKTGEQIPPELMNDPRLNQVVEVKNEVVYMDMDILIEDAPDTVTLQGEMFEMFTAAVQSSGQQIPIEVWLELMPNLPRKRYILDKLQGDPKQAQARNQEAQEQKQIQQVVLKTELESKQADIAKKMADAGKSQAETDQTLIENQLMRIMPDQPKVRI